MHSVYWAQHVREDGMARDDSACDHGQAPDWSVESGFTSADSAGLGADRGRAGSGQRGAVPILDSVSTASVPAADSTASRQTFACWSVSPTGVSKQIKALEGQLTETKAEIAGQDAAAGSDRIETLEAQRADALAYERRPDPTEELDRQRSVMRQLEASAEATMNKWAEYEAQASVEVATIQRLQERHSAILAQLTEIDEQTEPTLQRLKRAKSMASIAEDMARLNIDTCPLCFREGVEVGAVAAQNNDRLLQRTAAHETATQRSRELVAEMEKISAEVGRRAHTLESTKESLTAQRATLRGSDRANKIDHRRTGECLEARCVYRAQFDGIAAAD